MKVVIQTVKNASVLINGKTRNSIENGMLILAGFTIDDNDEKIDKMIHKISGLRVFTDANDKMNLSLNDVNGELLVISNFTLYGNLNHGFRPSFENSLEPIKSNALYDSFISKLKDVFPDRVKTGKFGAHMEVSLVNIGPKTFIYEV